MRPISSWTSVALLLCLACHDQSPAPVQKLVAISGDVQSAAALESLPLPLTIEARRADGSTAPDVAVQWSVESTGGALATDAAPAVDATTKTVTTRTSSDGRATAWWRLGPTVGTQHVTAQIVDAPSAQVALTAGALGVLVVRYDGTQWKTQLADSTNAYRALQAVWGTSPSAVAALGTCGPTPGTAGLLSGSLRLSLVLRYDGAAWRPEGVDPNVSSDCSFSPTAPYTDFPTAIGGRSGSDLFVLETVRNSNTWGRDVLENDGSGWRRSLGGDTGFPPAYASPNGIWFGSGSTAYVVSGADRATNGKPSGLIERFDGSTWSIVYPVGARDVLGGDSTKGFLAIWGTSESDLTVVGRPGSIIHYDGSTWALQTSAATADLRSVHGLSSTNIMAVGDSGTIVHYDGSSWSRQSSGTTVNLYGVQMVSPTLAFAVGDSGVVVQYDGSKWTPTTVNRSINFRGVWAASASAVLAVGAPRR
jgi:hypothetical protein